MTTNRALCRPILARGAAVGALVYLSLLTINLLGSGTTSWAYPSAACASNEVIEDGVFSYPDCPTSGGTDWYQRAVNLPVRVALRVWPTTAIRVQEFRLPPRQPSSKRWSGGAWLATGVLAYVLAGVCAAMLAVIVTAIAPRRWRERVVSARRSRFASSLVSIVLAGAAVLALRVALASPTPIVRDAATHPLPEVRALTQGPRFHFFGYYDKFQVDPSGRHVLGMAVDFDAREVKASDVLEIGMVDLEDDMKWTRLGRSRSWNWQQGCMLQWIPGSDDEIIWNDRDGNGADARLVARVLDIGSGQRRELPHPIYTITPDGKTALSLDFSRLFRARRTYGYPGVHDPNEGVFAPADDGIFAMDMESGERELILSLADIVAFGRPRGSEPVGEHYVEMLRLNPSGTRFLFFERWFDGPMRSRLFTANLDGSDMFLVSAAGGKVSHVDWLDDRHLAVYASSQGGYVLFEDRRGVASMLLETSRDGHETFLPGGEWMVSDTYADYARQQHPFLYHLPSGTTFALAHLLAPEAYDGVLRCDNHPRVSRDGRRIFIDSTHDGGRQMYMIDIGEILDSVE